MKKLFTLLVVLLSLCCQDSKPLNNYVLIYEFENAEDITIQDMQHTVKVINNRLNKFASNHEVRLNNKQQVEVKLSTNYIMESVNSIVTNTGKLEFWECIDIKYLDTFFRDMFEIIESDYKLAINSEDGFFPASGGLLSFNESQEAIFKEVLERQDLLAKLPQEIRRSKFLFGHPQNGRIDLFLVKLPPSGTAFVNDSHITDANSSFNSIGRPTVAITMNPTGAQRWERMTRIAFEDRSQIAIVLNDIVYSAPTVSFGPIKGGNTEISGNFNEEEARDLALILGSSGRIPQLKFVSSNSVSED